MIRFAICQRGSTTVYFADDVGSALGETAPFLPRSFLSPSIAAVTVSYIQGIISINRQERIHISSKRATCTNGIRSSISTRYDAVATLCNSETTRNELSQTGIIFQDKKWLTPARVRRPCDVKAECPVCYSHHLLNIAYRNAIEICWLTCTSVQRAQSRNESRF